MQSRQRRHNGGSRSFVPALTALVFVLLPALGRAAEEEESPIASHWAKGDSFCDNTCAVTFSAGKFLKTEMVQVFGTTDEFIPIWDCTCEGSGIVTGAFTRKIGDFGQYVGIDAEAGIGKRFGATKEIELWGATYYRWKWFPWNDYVRTTIGVSTGFNWASGIPEKERIRAINKVGRQFLHYFSPEITFALPSKPEWELHVRIHHCSGWFFYRDIGGGAQFLTLGVRKYF
jgi:hypothetical protein